MREIVEALKKEGFEVVDYSDVKSSVDLIAKRGKEVLVLRVLGNLDALKPQHAEDMAKLASLLEGKAIVIAERSRWGVLEDDTVYYRYGIPAMNPRTFLAFLRGDLPRVLYTKGRGIVRIDAEKLRRRREELGLSLQRLAELVGTTKETIYRYERGYYPSLEMARRLEEALGVELIEGFEPSAEEPREELHFPFDVLRSLGGRVSEFRRLPWSAMGRGRLTITFLHNISHRQLPRRLKEIRRARGTLFRYYLYVGNAPGVPSIGEEEILEARSFKEIEKIARERNEES
ncbi:MAG: helix-turn-helix domain-containing protein [Candidatus Diapherotrites archaeon]|nr:helix-turn-helix domain-containing protein [Candidatus Diapherotrites archaeon]